ncbi:hypothetical protein DV737_g5700, partial [Chaetothyriales sp. CBS 132003]
METVTGSRPNPAIILVPLTFIFFLLVVPAACYYTPLSRADGPRRLSNLQSTTPTPIQYQHVHSSSSRRDVPPPYTPQYKSSQYKPSQYKSPQYNSLQHNSPQYNSPQYNSPQYNSPQYNSPLLSPPLDPPPRCAANAFDISLWIAFLATLASHWPVFLSRPGNIN